MFRIFSSPEEGLASRAFEAGGINFAAMEHGLVLGGEVFSNNSHKVHWREKAGGDGEIRCSATDNAVDFAVRAFDGIKCDGTYDK